jgi:hypothetical protein
MEERLETVVSLLVGGQVLVETKIVFPACAELFRTGPKSGSRFHPPARTGPEVRFGVQVRARNSEPVRTGFEPTMAGRDLFNSRLGGQCDRRSIS